MVGKQKQGGKKFIFWKQQNGAAYPKNTCTWEPSSISEFDPDDLLGQPVVFKAGRSEFKGKIKKHEGGSNYWVEFESRRHTSRSVDLELSLPVSNGGYSWWRLTGYETNEESEGEDEEEEEESEVDDD